MSINSEIEMQVMKKMVKKLYPHFDENRDYCIWFIFDMYEEQSVFLKNGSINFYDKNNDSLHFLPQRTFFCIRTPYPNKTISQIGLKKGTKRVYGVPIVIPDLNKLLRIESFTVEWEGMLLKPEALLMLFNNKYTLEYDLDYIKRNHWIVIKHQDYWNYDETTNILEWYDNERCFSNLRIISGFLSTDKVICFTKKKLERCCYVSKVLPKDEEDIIRIFSLNMLQMLDELYSDDFMDIIIKPIDVKFIERSKHIYLGKRDYGITYPEPSLGFD